MSYNRMQYLFFKHSIKYNTSVRKYMYICKVNTDQDAKYACKNS